MLNITLCAKVHGGVKKFRSGKVHLTLCRKVVKLCTNDVRNCRSFTNFDWCLEGKNSEIISHFCCGKNANAQPQKWLIVAANLCWQNYPTQNYDFGQINHYKHSTQWQLSWLGYKFRFDRIYLTLFRWCICIVLT